MAVLRAPARTRDVGAASGPLAAGGVLVGAALLAAGLGVAAGSLPLIALVLPLAALAGVAVVTRMNAALLIVLFILYSNAAAVAVRLHGVPVVVAAAFPLMLGIPLAYRLLVLRQPLVLTRVVPLLVLYVLASTVSALLSRDSVRAFDAVVTLLVEGVLLYLLVTNVIRSTDALRLALWAVVAAGAFMGGLSLLQEVTRTHANDYFGFAQMTTVFRVGDPTLAGDILQPRAAGPIGEMNFYAQILLMLIPLGLALAWIERARLLRLAALGSIALIGAGVALTFSRGAAVGFVMTIGLAVLLRLIRPRQLALVALGGALLLAAFPNYLERLTTLDVREADTSLQSRALENQAAALTFRDHPIVGVGPSVFPTYYRDYVAEIGGRLQGDTREAHNLYLGVASETGVLGALAFAGILLVTLRGLFAARARGPDRLAVMATALIFSLLLFLTTSVFLHLAYERYFWLMLALAGAAGAIGAGARRGTGEAASPAG